MATAERTKIVSGLQFQAVETGRPSGPEIFTKDMHIANSELELRALAHHRGKKCEAVDNGKDRMWATVSYRKLSRCRLLKATGVKSTKVECRIS